jgi:zinc-ribbon domain
VCPRCGNSIPPSARYCPACGRALGWPAPPTAWYPYPYPPYPPRRDHTVLLIAVIIVLVTVVPVALSAILYLLVSGIVASPGPGMTRPVVTFSLPSKMNAITWTLSIASAQPQVASSNYLLDFGMYGAINGTPTPMGVTGINVTIPGTSPTVGIVWTDVDGRNTVSAGDVLTVRFGSAPNPGTSLSFVLLWHDGFLIVRVDWSA